MPWWNRRPPEIGLSCRQKNADITERVVELWCKIHDEILCSTCVIMNHSSCEGLKFISGNIGDLLQDPELHENMKELKNTRERLPKPKDDLELVREDLLHVKHAYIDMVEHHKKKLISIIESLVKADVKAINIWYNERKSKLNCQDGRELADHRDAQIKSNKEYKLNLDIENYLSSFQNLGSFQEKIHVYKATSMRRAKVKVSKDQSKCSISDICLMSDGSILVTDQKNKKLKRIDGSTYTVTDHCDLPGNPWAVCCVGPQEVAVGLCYKNMIQFVSIGNRMIPSRSIPLGYWCRGLSYNDGELFVSDAGKNVFVYNLSGTQQRSISKTPSGEAMFSITRHISVLEGKVYIVDKDHGLICTDEKGTELYRYKGIQVKNVYGVCADGHGGTFLCGFNTNNVVQVGGDGEELGVVLSPADGLKKPQAVCFNHSNQVLIVAIDGSDEILLFSLV